MLFALWSCYGQYQHEHLYIDLLVSMYSWSNYLAERGIPESGVSESQFGLMMPRVLQSGPVTNIHVYMTTSRVNWESGHCLKEMFSDAALVERSSVILRVSVCDCFALITKQTNISVTYLLSLKIVYPLLPGILGFKSTSVLIEAGEMSFLLNPDYTCSSPGSWSHRSPWLPHSNITVCSSCSLGAVGGN